MKPTLLILAAGMGSRYGGLKQMDELGPSGESIIDYSIYDAIHAGFGKVVFVVRESFLSEFKKRFEPRLKGKIKTEYVLQEIYNLPLGYTPPAEREKPWGTGHAMLMARNVISTPFAIINADDFYGRESYEQAAAFIQNNPKDNDYAMLGYALKNTLSKHGTVSRAICEVDSNQRLTHLVERTKIGYENDKIFFYENDEKTELTGNEAASMNFWIFKPSFFKYLEKGFIEFLEEKGKELKSEFYFNQLAGELTKKKVAETEIINTTAQWFGITYQADKPLVQASLKELHKNGKYPENLWD